MVKNEPLGNRKLMSCNYCWPGNCHGGPNCENDKPSNRDATKPIKKTNKKTKILNASRLDSLSPISANRKANLSCDRIAHSVAGTLETN